MIRLEAFVLVISYHPKMKWFTAIPQWGAMLCWSSQRPTDSFPSAKRSSVIYLVGGDDPAKFKASTFSALSDLFSCRYGKFFENLSALGTNGAHQVHDDFTCGLRGGDSSVPRALAIFSATEMDFRGVQNTQQLQKWVMAQKQRV